MKHVLIVEDMSDHAFILQRHFGKMGFLTSVCTDVFLLLQRVKEHLVDAVTIDISMPDVSGIDVIGYIREVDSKIKIVVITANATEAMRITCLQKGANYYFVKPVNFNDLKMVFKDGKD